MTRTSWNEQVEVPAPIAVTPVRRLLVARRLGARLVSAAIVLFGTATLTFLAQAALPGDRATAILNVRTGQTEARSPEELAPIIAEYGLDRPVLVQFWDHLRSLAVGDLGSSYQQHRPVIDIIGEQLGATIVLAVTALLFAWVLMVVWVVLTAGRGPRIGAAGSLLEVFTAGLPSYWLGIILLLVFAAGLGWFPVIGGSGPDGLILPALTLAIPLAGFLGQATRAEFERSLDQPFVVSARMRGMGDMGVRLRHVLRHAVLPAISLSGWALGATLSGAVVVEAVFTRPGIGHILVNAVGSQDLPIVVGVVVLIAVFYVLANLLVDIAYALVDPRLRRSA
ncbi:MAG TPA: ABC transporter permease [Actinomycetota bacterium]|jgi:peptide/nickel transport system permease protein|nr:ABC transporter permease [Actinomycetota bacterium]